MNNIFLNALKIIGIKIAVSFIYFAMLFMLPLVEGIKGGAMIYSAAICLLLFYWLFKEAVAWGRKYIAKSQPPFMGVLIGAIAEIPSAVILAAAVFVKKLNTVYLIYNAPFMAFFSTDGKIFELTGPGILYILPIILIPAVCGISYYLGYKRVEFDGNILHKIMYREDKSGEDEANGKKEE